MSQNEFISMSGDKMLKCILQECKEGRYYSIITDAVCSVSHEEQSVLMLSHVSQNNENDQYDIEERLTEFLNFNGKSGESILLLSSSSQL